MADSMQELNRVFSYDNNNNNNSSKIDEFEKWKMANDFAVKRF